jgi:translation initiation factor 1
METKKGIFLLRNQDANSRLVYSTESGRICPACGKQSAQCICKKKKKHSIPKGDEKIRVERYSKGRKGKGVTLISGLPLEGPSLKELAKKLKQQCGTGGTVKNGVVEIQGDHRDFLAEHLNSLGYKAIKAGG